MMEFVFLCELSLSRRNKDLGNVNEYVVLFRDLV